MFVIPEDLILQARGDETMLIVDAPLVFLLGFLVETTFGNASE